MAGVLPAHMKRIRKSEADIAGLRGQIDALKKSNKLQADQIKLLQEGRTQVSDLSPPHDLIWVFVKSGVPLGLPAGLYGRRLEISYNGSGQIQMIECPEDNDLFPLTDWPMGHGRIFPSATCLITQIRSDTQRGLWVPIAGDTHGMLATITDAPEIISGILRYPWRQQTVWATSDPMIGWDTTTKDASGADMILGKARMITKLNPAISLRYALDVGTPIIVFPVGQYSQDFVFSAAMEPYTTLCEEP